MWSRKITRKTFALALTFGAAGLGRAAGAQEKAGAPAAVDPALGYLDTPVLPGLPYHVHDPNRPHPPVVTPGAKPGDAPSDAIVLFDGTDLSHWTSEKNGPPLWKLENGCAEPVADMGDLVSKEKFGDCQVHVEWCAPSVIEGRSQRRANSGIILMRRYEVQVLDSYDNITYADGQAGAIYGQWPPLVNAARKPGEWQTYDLVFEAPRFEGSRLVKPACITLLWNGVLIHNRKESMGAVRWREVAFYTPHPPEDSLLLQGRGGGPRFRNIWVRRLGCYDRG